MGVEISSTKVSHKIHITNKEVKEGLYKPIAGTFRVKQYLPNPKYLEGSVRLDDVRTYKDGTNPFNLVYNSNKSAPLQRKKSGLIIHREAKWKRFFNCLVVDEMTGEVLDAVYETDDQKGCTARKIKSLNEFCDNYQPLYNKKQVTLWMVTFTEADQALLDKNWSSMVEKVVRRFKSIGYPVRGYWWTMEVAKDTFHFHYHLVLAVDRMDIRGKTIPEAIKFNDVWQMISKTEMVRKNIRGYLSKYLSKNRWRVRGADGSIFRMYGKSNKFN